MTRVTVTLLEEQRGALRGLLLRDEKESAAIVLCGRSQHVDAWTGEEAERFYVRRILEVPDEAFTLRACP